tara:strand:- start:215 stop:742 length:528 start_codon:yes stop_codon:yes gene_type:complete
MAYFSHFPKVSYDVRGNGSTQQMINITKRVRFRDYMKQNYVTYDFYDVKSGETPEYIANEFYGDPELHWVVLLANDIIDYYNEWPMTVPQFERYVKSKYDDVNGIHHYEYTQESGDTKFTIELPNDSATTLPNSALPVTNYQYEENLQEQRRRIRLIQSRFIGQIKKEFKNRMNG